jgi:ribonuclease BN (tRNA processing enzyme)
MKVFFGGVRGTNPRADKQFAEYGGHTTCLFIQGESGQRIMLDAGSGVQAVSKHLAKSQSKHLLLAMTHLHLDHMIGLPMLPLLFDPQQTIDIMAAGSAGLTASAALDRLLSPPLWPVTIEQMPAKIQVQELEINRLAADHIQFKRKGLEMRGVAVAHPGGCIAWRIDEPASGQSLVFATDVEWSASGDRQRQDLIALISGPTPANLLIMDGNFTADELPQHEGWGHSSTAQCVDVAREGGAHRLLVTHHAPDRDDERLAAIEADLKTMWPEAALARQDQIIDLEDLKP